MLLKLKIMVLSIILKFIYGSNKKYVNGRENYISLIDKNKSIIFSVWHSHLLSIVHDLRNMEINALAGTHSDADLISHIATKWGWKMVRGSSKEKGSEAYKSMLRLIKNSNRSLLFITPDGPSGPPKVPKKGIIRLAQNTNAGIIPIRVNYTRSWGFKNWDTFYLAKPFGTISIEYGQVIYLKKSQSYETCSQILIDSMKGN
tara:strand:- start:43 stop:648 length:606 start_codon:yes stop_codon:yes gene_type:complete